MITITIPHPDADYERRHGPSRWTETLSDAHYVWEAFGVDLKGLDGMRSGDCAVFIQGLINDILSDPVRVLSSGVSYPDMRATVANLTGLFFTLRERNDGIVSVT